MKRFLQFFLAILLVFINLSNSAPVAGNDALKEAVYEINPPTTDLNWLVIEYFDIETSSYQQFDVAIELFGSIAPKTTENFHKISNGIKALLPNAEDKSEAMTLIYGGTEISIIKPDEYVQMGDVLPIVPSFSTFGYSFPDETHQVTFDRPGRVAMAKTNGDENGCQFFITTNALPSYNDEYVIFGQVVEGLDMFIEKVQYLNKNKLPAGLEYAAKIIYSRSVTLHHDNIEGAKEEYLAQVADYRSGKVTEKNSMKFNPMLRSKQYEQHMELVTNSDKKISNDNVVHVESSQAEKIGGNKSHYSSNPIEVLAVLICKLLIIGAVGYSLNYIYTKNKNKILSKFGSGAGSGSDYKVVGLRHN
ncbi:hypothetical protein QEN19_000955 [Hanseniaspora menglaensis]